MNQNRSGSSLLVEKGKQRGTRRYKARLPIIQRLSFSVGHFLNDAVVGAWVSYMLVFQTKVLGISNRTAGFLWILSSTVDSVLSLAVGYICDNLKFPLFAKYYGKRKSFHLLGTILVAGLFPFLMMPCFVCGKDSSEWKMGIYYGTIMIVHNIGWALSQVTHLALIPEIAKRPNEMVELHALRWVNIIFSAYYNVTENCIFFGRGSVSISIGASLKSFTKKKKHKTNCQERKRVVLLKKNEICQSVHLPMLFTKASCERLEKQKSMKEDCQTSIARKPEIHAGDKNKLLLSFLCLKPEYLWQRLRPSKKCQKYLYRQECM